jgi:hypothetical protein
MAEQLGPGGGSPRGRALSEIAEHGNGPGGTAAADDPALHRRQVLRLVDHDVAQAGRALDQVPSLVDEQAAG